jgi:hypothetical protein
MCWSSAVAVVGQVLIAVAAKAGAAAVLAVF